MSGSVLLEVARQAEDYIQAMDKIKTVVLKITRSSDWVDMGGIPYLQATGAEKVARIFGVSWKIAEGYPRKEPLSDGHYMYVYRGTFRLREHEIEVEGRRSSRDDFFRVRYVWRGNKRERVELSPEEVDEGNVRMAAFTNWINNGIKRLLGLRNLTWEDLEAAGINRPQKTVEYQGKKSQAESASQDKSSFQGTRGVQSSQGSVSQGNGKKEEVEKVWAEIHALIQKAGFDWDLVKAEMSKRFKKTKPDDLTLLEVRGLLTWLKDQTKAVGEKKYPDKPSRESERANGELVKIWEEINEVIQQAGFNWQGVKEEIQARFGKNDPDALTLMEAKALLTFLKQQAGAVASGQAKDRSLFDGARA